MMKKSVGLFFLPSLILVLSSCAPTTIDTIPSGASVYRGEAQVGTTPFDTRVVLTAQNYTVKKERYFDEPVKLDFNSPRTLELKLRTMPVLVYSKPAATIYPAGSDTAIGQTPMKINVLDTEKTYTLKAADYYDKDIPVGLDSPDPLVVELPRRPIVTLSAKPDGVEIYENGARIGTAPIRQEILTRRTFELRKAGYFTRSLTLTGAPPYEVAVELKVFPVITVSATPAGAEISRKGGRIGKDSAKLAVGESTVLEVRADRFYPQSVTLTPESPAQVRVDLKAMPYVMIRSEPSGANVMINGKSVGRTPVEQLIEAETAVTLSKEGFTPQSVTLTGKDPAVTRILEVAAVHPTPEELAEEAAAKAAAEKAAAEAAAEKAAAEKAAKQRKLMMMAGGAAVVLIAAAVVILKTKKKK
jgi:hypothetical protein